MPTSRTRRLFYTGATALGLLAGAAGLSAAATGKSATPVNQNSSMEQVGDAVDGPDNNPSYTASITAPDDENEANLAALATINADQARQAAEAATGGVAGSAHLENENGNVVYGVEVTRPDGSVIDVKVDAGNANVLSQQDDDREQHDDGPKADAGGDHDQETADD